MMKPKLNEPSTIIVQTFLTNGKGVGIETVSNCKSCHAFHSKVSLVLGKVGRHSPLTVVDLFPVL